MVFGTDLKALNEPATDIVKFSNANSIWVMSILLAAIHDHFETVYYWEKKLYLL